ncbi:MAG: two-component system, OmpR family, response regulator, partial [Nocardioidaceae bacterium]|nr:two-component system, OmpR family, response regulator [Nocardioidaceae bacterium]
MAGLLRRGLAQQGWVATAVRTAAEAQDAALSGHWDVIVCDVMLPDLSGLDLCRWLRTNSIWSPILLLTARTSVVDRVAGLDAGADDYLGKPFAFAELDARLHALVRRGPAERPTVLEVGPFRLDPRTHQASINGAALELSPKEFALLHLFLRRPQEVLSRSTILDHVWDFAYDGGSNVVDVYVRYLRLKLAAHGVE